MKLGPETDAVCVAELGVIYDFLDFADFVFADWRIWVRFQG